MVSTDMNLIDVYTVEVECEALGGTFYYTTVKKTTFELTLTESAFDPCINTQFILDQTISSSYTLRIGESHTETLFTVDDTENKATKGSDPNNSKCGA